MKLDSIRPRLLRPVHDDLSSLEGYEAAADHAIELRQDGLDLVFAVYTLDHERQVQGQSEHLFGVDTGAGPESHDASKHRGASKMTFAKKVHDRLVEWSAVVLVPLSDMNPHQDPLTRQTVHQAASRFRAALARE